MKTPPHHDDRYLPGLIRDATRKFGLRVSRNISRKISSPSQFKKNVPNQTMGQKRIVNTHLPSYTRLASSITSPVPVPVSATSLVGVFSQTYPNAFRLAVYPMRDQPDSTIFQPFHRARNNFVGRNPFKGGMLG